MKYCLALLLLTLIIIPMRLNAMDAPVGSSQYSFSTKTDADTKHELTDAYNFMSIGHYAEALRAYENVISAEPYNLDAWRGRLWASNSLQRWRKTLRDGKLFLQNHESDQDIRLYMAYAASMNGDFLYARNLYLQNQGKTEYMQSKYLGLAWTYRSLGDYARSQRYTKQYNRIIAAQNLYNQSLPPKMYRSVRAYGSYMSSSQHNHSLYQQYTFHYGTSQISSAMDRYSYMKELLRTDYAVKLHQNTTIFNLDAESHWLKGDYVNLYPATSFYGALSKPVYLGSFIFDTAISGANTHYPVLSVYQYGFSEQIRNDHWGVSASSYFLYHDYDTPDLDTRTNWSIGRITFIPIQQVQTSLFAGTGNKEFVVGPLSGVIDNNMAATSELGATLSYFYRIIGMDLNLLQEKYKDGTTCRSVSLGLSLELQK